MPKEEARQKEREKYDSWYYEEEYWKEDDIRKENKRYHYDDPGHEKRFSFLTRLLTENFQFNTFLDVGCGMGHMVRNLLRKGFQGKGVEVSKAALAEHLVDLKRGDIVRFAGAEKLPFDDGQFDLVFCLDVMEHLPRFDVEQAIKELTRVTKKYLVLTINLDNPYIYHPSMFTRKEWEIKFLKEERLKQLKDVQNKIEKKCKQKYPEYDFFVFTKI